MLKAISIIRLRLQVGQMAPTPAIASALGQRGVNIMKFLQSFNSLMKDESKGSNVIVIAHIFQNKTFTIIVKGRTVADLLKEAAGISKGSSEPGKVRQGNLTMSQIIEVAKMKSKNMRNKTEKGLIKMLIGTARSIGIEILEEEMKI